MILVIREGYVRLRSITLCTERLDITNQEISFFLYQGLYEQVRFHRFIIPIITEFILSSR